MGLSLAPGVLFSNRECEELLAEANSKLPPWGNIFNDVPTVQSDIHFFCVNTFFFKNA